MQVHALLWKPRNCFVYNIIKRHGTNWNIWKEFISCLLDHLSNNLNKNLRLLLCSTYTQENRCFIVCNATVTSKNHCTLGLKSDGNLYGSKTHSCTFLRSIETFFYCVVYNPFNSNGILFGETHYEMCLSRQSQTKLYFCYFFSPSVISIKISMELFSLP